MTGGVPVLKVDDLCCPGVYVFYVEHIREAYVGETNLLMRRTLQDHMSALLAGIHTNTGLQDMFDNWRSDMCIALFPMRGASKETLLDLENKKSLEYKESGWTIHNRYGNERCHLDVTQSPIARYIQPEKVLYFCEFCRSDIAKPLSAPNIVRERLVAHLDSGMSYRVIAARYDVTPAMGWRIINEGYEPSRVDIREKLGYKYVCPNCGHEFEEE